MPAKKPQATRKGTQKPRPRPEPSTKAKAKGSEIAPQASLKEQIQVFCRLRVGGMTQGEAAKTVRPHLSTATANRLGTEWEAQAKTQIRAMQKAQAKAAELLHGVTKASQIGWFLAVRDATLEDNDSPSSKLVQKFSVTKRYDKERNVTSETTTVEIPSKMAAAIEINRMLGYHHDPDDLEDGEDATEARSKDTLADFMRKFVRAGMPIEHRQEDIKAGRIIDAKVTVVAQADQEAVDSDAE